MGISPFTDVNGNGAELVDKMIGTAYRVVRNVAENIEYVKHVSANMAEVYRLVGSIEAVDALYADIGNIDAIFAQLDALIALGPIATDLALIADNMVSIISARDNLAAIIAAPGQAAAAATSAAAAHTDMLTVAADKAIVIADMGTVAADKATTLGYKNTADADRVQTAADRVQTGLDKVATAADRVQTGLDKVATAADRVQTGLDKVATAADRVQTGLDRTAASGSAAAAAAAVASIALPAGVANTMLIRDPGNIAYLAKPFADVRDALDTAPYVASRTALKALNYLKDSTALMTADRPGQWTFVDGDLNDALVADTSEVNYVRPGTVNANTYGSSWDLTLGWTTFGSAVLNNVVAGPYAERLMGSIKEDASTGGHGIFSTRSFVTGQAYTHSAFVKQGVGTRNVTLAFGATFPANARAATFNPSTGAVVAADAAIVTTVTLVNGVYRFSITSTASLTQTDQPTVKLASGTTVSYVGDNTSLIYVTGVKLEQAAAPTSLGAWQFVSDRFVGQFATPAIRTIEQKLWDRADLRDWNGLDLTGVNDNATLVQAAVNAMAGVGNKLYAPAGKMVLGSTVTIPDASHVEGPAREGGYYNVKSAFFHFGHTGVGFKINTNLGSRSLKNLNTYRTQPTPGAGAYTPTAHDYDIDIEGGQDSELENIMFLNATKAINIRGNQTTSAPCGRISMKGLRGQPLSEGIRMTHCTDVVYMDEIHFWPFWSANTQVMTWMRNNLGALIMGRVDNPKIGRFFCFAAYRGLNIINQGALGSLPVGTVGRLAANVFEADNCSVGMLIAGTNVTADFAHFHCASDPGMPTISTESLLWFLGTGADINIGSLRGQYTNAALVAMNGTGNTLTVARSQSANIDSDANGPAEFAIDATNKLRLLSQPITSAPTPYSTTGEIQVNGQLFATGTWDPASLVNGASGSTTIGVNGAAIGDVALASLSTVVAGGWHISATVTAANVVTVTLENVTGATVDLASGTLKVSVFKR